MSQEATTTTATTEAPIATPPAESTAPANTQETKPAESTAPKVSENTEVKPTVEKPGDKPGDTQETKPAKVVPEKYDLKVSENSLVDAAFTDKIAAVAKAQGLSQEEAQALLVSEEKRLAEFVDAQSQAWLKESQADSEIGGEALVQNAEYAKRAIDHFGSPKLKAELNRFGYGNHPEMIRFCSKVGRMMQDDKFVTASSGDTGNSRSVADVLYGGTKE